MTFALQRDCISVVPFLVKQYRLVFQFTKGNFHGINMYVFIEKFHLQKIAFGRISHYHRGQNKNTSCIRL